MSAADPAATPGEEAADRAVGALLRRQSPEGFWHDYRLEVGSSRAWTTAYVGHALLPFAALPRVARSLDRAAAAILRVAAPEGWGYNLVTACDADSTAWCVRFLYGLGRPPTPSAHELLLPYMDAQGDVRTFRDARFGSWSTPHLDVAAMAGIALLEAGAPTASVRPIVRRAAERLAHERSPRPFWWVDGRYLSHVCAELFSRWEAAASEAPQTRAAARTLRGRERSRADAFGLALGALADDALAAKPASPAVGAALHQRAERGRSRLRRLQRGDGSFPASAWMRIPGQQRPDRSPELAADDEALVTTATALRALHQAG